MPAGVPVAVLRRADQGRGHAAVALRGALRAGAGAAGQGDSHAYLGGWVIAI